MSDNIITALIAGGVSIFISGATGAYTLYKNNTKLYDLRKELIHKSLTEDYIETRRDYLNKFRDFETKFNYLHKSNPNDGTEKLQYTIDFYANHAKNYYLRNILFLKSETLDSLYQIIGKTIESEKLNRPENLQNRRDFGHNIISFCKELHKISINNNSYNL